MLLKSHRFDGSRSKSRPWILNQDSQTNLPWINTLQHSIFHSPSSVALINFFPSLISQKLVECEKRNGKSSISVLGTFSAPEFIIIWIFCSQSCQKKCQNGFLIWLQEIPCIVSAWLLQKIVTSISCFSPAAIQSLIISRINKSEVGNEGKGKKPLNILNGVSIPNVYFPSHLSRNYSARLEMLRIHLLIESHTRFQVSL